MAQQESKKTRIYRGEVISDKMDKTVVVEHTRTVRNSLTDKIMRKKKKYKVHDEREEATVGDIVEFVEGRPLSKTKYMVLHSVVTPSATK